MDMWSVLTLLVFAGCMIAGNYYWFKALGNLSPTGESKGSLRVMILGILAGRENFSVEGWRYRNRSLLAGLAWGIWIVIWAVFGMGKS
jgi:hypothetical protein